MGGCAINCFLINRVAGGDAGHAPTVGSPALSSPAWMHPKRERFGANWAWSTAKVGSSGQGCVGWDKKGAGFA